MTHGSKSYWTKRREEREALLRQYTPAYVDLTKIENWLYAGGTFLAKDREYAKLSELEKAFTQSDYFTFWRAIFSGCSIKEAKDFAKLTDSIITAVQLQQFSGEK